MAPPSALHPLSTSDAHFRFLLSFSFHISMFFLEQYTILCIIFLLIRATECLHLFSDVLLLFLVHVSQTVTLTFKITLRCIRTLIYSCVRRRMDRLFQQKNRFRLMRRNVLRMMSVCAGREVRRAESRRLELRRHPVCTFSGEWLHLNARQEVTP